MPFTSFFQHPGGIAITGGLFSDASVSVVIGRVECVGNETGLLECVYVTNGHKEVDECDSAATAAVRCQGFCLKIFDTCLTINILLY